MYLIEQQSKLLEINLENLKKTDKGISTYGEREIRTILETSEDFAKNHISKDVLDFNIFYSQKLLFDELKKISGAIKKNPNLNDQFLDIKKNVAILIKMKAKNCSEADEYFKIIICKIVKLQAALGITPSIYFYDIVEDLANQLYMDVVNCHYKDPYVKVK